MFPKGYCRTWCSSLFNMRPFIFLRFYQPPYINVGLLNNCITPDVWKTLWLKTLPVALWSVWGAVKVVFFRQPRMPLQPEAQPPQVWWRLWWRLQRPTTKLTWPLIRFAEPPGIAMNLLALATFSNTVHIVDTISRPGLWPGRDILGCGAPHAQDCATQNCDHIASMNGSFGCWVFPRLVGYLKRLSEETFP